MSNEPINDVAGRLRLLVESLYLDIDCERCKGWLTKDGKSCHAFSWDITYYPDTDMGTWSFSLNLHTKEILFTRTRGSITEALMDAYGKVLDFKLTYNHQIPKKD